MSYLDKLLQGAPVEWKPLKEVVKTIIAPIKVKKEVYQKVGKIPIVDQGVDLIAGYTDEELNTVELDEYVIFGDHSEHIKYIDFEFIQGADGLKILKSLSDNTKYIYYAFSNYYKKELSYKRHWTKAKETLLPIPPLSVQEEIVRILDKFTALEAELEAELDCRKRQYEYYRDHLLTVNEQGLMNNQKVEWKTLGDIGEVKMCKRILKSETRLEGDIPFYKIGTFGKEANAYISREIYELYRKRYPFPKKGDILISASGTIGRTVVYNGEPAYFQDSNIVWIDNDESIVSNRYLWHFYKVAKWFVSGGGTIDRLYNDNIRKTKIPVPPIEEQERIVEILDKFDTLAHSISEGLPKEIELRKKQYEYYRDQLLSFNG
ncbi:restriction endonuclease subunit S [Riemerella anatipestifer]|uniref:restriction endonuclease subunit S n=1 Tax=Riemerella anatipestifer TaxID=34085 RepID=UPI00129E001B|nr:restriction endonuclease subunit S [Riemerella anatipestifer]MRM96950.1 restriction endonuclease subunit S [Riemerella anatipestifer]